jgi:NitT/TauT family transport system permease protein/sulfonate transport system permease protein
MAVVQQPRTRRRPTTRPAGGSGAVSRVLIPVVSLVGTFAVWEAAVRITGSQATIPPPSAVASAAQELWSSGALLDSVGWSTRRALLGFAVGSVAGVLVGLMTGRMRLVRILLEPLIQLLRPIPALAWVPVSILWFGVGESPKIFLIALGVFFPVWLSTHLGVSATPAIFLEVASTLGVPSRATFFRVAFPAALPHIVSGLRVAFALAFILLVAAELTGTSVGLGALISQASLIYRPDRMFVGMLALGVLGAVVDQLLTRAIRRLNYWD